MQKGPCLMDETLLKTPLADEHVSLGARMVPFAGWYMPVQYPEGILAEHRYTREHVSLFDICHMGEFLVAGAGSSLSLDQALARSVVDQKVGSCRYNFLLNEQGGVIDDLIVYRMQQESFILVVNAARIEVDFATLRERIPSFIPMENMSDRLAKFDLQGPESADVLVSLGIEADALPKYYHWASFQLFGTTVMISRTGYTGELGFELYFEADRAVDVWRKLLACPGVKPAGLGARDTLRLEMGYPLYGDEMDETTTPIEAGFGPLLKLGVIPRVFVGSDALRNTPPKKHLRGIVLEGRRAAHTGTPLLYKGEQVGTITSGTLAPSLGCAVAMAYLDASKEIPEDAEFDVELHRATVKARLAPLPFWTHGTANPKK